MAQVLIRNLDEDILARLKTKADTEGLSLEAYLRGALKKISGPNREELLAAVDAIRAQSRPWKPGEPQAQDYVREARDEREAYAKRPIAKS